MNERLPNTNAHNEYGDNQPAPAHELRPSPAVEPDSNAEWQLRWAVSEALLRTVYEVVEHPGADVRSAAATVALKVVQATRTFNLADEADQHSLATQADYVADRLIELVDAYDELTTGDLQGGVGAVAFMLVRNMLPVDGTERIEGGGHE
ncbi:hypothetical protein [Nocardia barduliensis]|uniref:hypothetical protein n=1 Tax=Nocardia barduliensis TaxID=2736643 RepID=UPI0015744140|nr:hypothetical protein [Nocardia barduliensis]